MKHGKFEAKRPAPQPVEQEEIERPKRRKWLLAAVPLLVIALLAACQLFWYFQPVPQGKETEWGLKKEETLAYFRSLAQTLEQEEMNLVLYPNDSASHDMPIVVTVPPAKSRVRVDLTGLEQDLENGVGKVERGRYLVEPANYVSLDRDALRQLAEQTEQEWSQGYSPAFAELSTCKEGRQERSILTVNIGKAGRVLSAEEIYQALIDAYMTGNTSPTLHYDTYIPQKLDVQEICRRVHTEPVNAALDQTSFEITPDIPGLGVAEAELERILAHAQPGKGYIIPLQSVPAEVTTAALEEELFGNILGEAHTPHVWDDDRTNNLILACDKLNGTVIMPGEIFSFNQTVGERTRERGYREATAYIAGNSVPEIGGGVCQVASSIYYATLQADLPAVERHPHTYLVTYVDPGMDAAIYWGQLDFQFENISPYPIKLEASVSDGQVHILLRGKEWKDYTLKLDYEKLEETPWSVEERVVYDDSFQPGEVIVTPYTGYLIATYKYLYDLDGNLIDTVQIAYSRYAKRNKVIALRWFTEPTTPDNGYDSNDGDDYNYDYDSDDEDNYDYNSDEDDDDA